MVFDPADRVLHIETFPFIFAALLFICFPFMASIVLFKEAEQYMEKIRTLELELELNALLVSASYLVCGLK